jgi:hypothetical protein
MSIDLVETCVLLAVAAALMSTIVFKKVNVALYVSCLAINSILADAFELRLSTGSCFVMILWPIY